jgi:hypothetical protein
MWDLQGAVYNIYLFIWSQKSTVRTHKICLLGHITITRVSFFWLDHLSSSAPNVVVEWLTLLIRIRAQHRRPAILTEALRGHPQSLQANAGIVP